MSQDSDEEAVIAATGGPHKADKRKLEDAIERENAKKCKAKEEADKKVCSSARPTAMPAWLTLCVAKC